MMQVLLARATDVVSSALAAWRGERERSATTTIAATPPNVDRFPYIAGVHMTPGLISNVLRQAETGYLRRYCDVLSEQREKVTHLHAVLSKREKAIAACKWIVEPAQVGEDGSRKNERAKKYAQYVQRRVGEIPQLSDAIEHLAGAIYFGRSALEIEWLRDLEGLGVRRLWPIHPKRLSYAGSWRVCLYDELGNELNPALAIYPGVDMHGAYPDKFVTHEPRTVACEIPTRQGLGRTLIWLSLFYLWAHRDQMRFAELFAQPWRIGTYLRDADDADKAQLEAALVQLSGMTSAVISERTKIELVTPQGTGSGQVHAMLRQAFNAEFSKVVLGETLTTELADATGSRAAAQVHDRQGEVRLAADGKAISETLTTYVVRPMVRRTFGTEAAELYCPSLRLVTEPDEDINAEFARVIELVDRGVKFDGDELRERFTTMSEPTEGEASDVHPKGAGGPEEESSKTTKEAA